MMSSLKDLLHVELINRGFRYSSQYDDVDHEYVSPDNEMQIYFDDCDSYITAMEIETCQEVAGLDDYSADGVLQWLQTAYPVVQDADIVLSNALQSEIDEVDWQISVTLLELQDLYEMRAKLKINLSDIAKKV